VSQGRFDRSDKAPAGSDDLDPHSPETIRGGLVLLLRQKIATVLFPRYSSLLDKVNINALVAKWMRENRSLPKFAKRNEMYHLIETEFLDGGPIDYLEFGVWRGESILYWADLNRNPESRFYGFDSFEGLPQNWGPTPPGTFGVGGLVPSTPDSRVQFVKGWFQDTLPEFLRSFVPRSRLVIHNDSDLYTSTIYTLTKLDGILAQGSIVIFDEFENPLHEFRAWKDYIESYWRVARPIALAEDGWSVKAAFILESEAPTRPG
jgi:O-methyltransferase